MLWWFLSRLARRWRGKLRPRSTAASRGNPIAQKAIRRNAVLLVAASQQEAMEWVNRIAPEHLTVDDDSAVALITERGLGLRGRLFGSIRGRLCGWAEPRSSHGRGRAISRRFERA